MCVSECVCECVCVSVCVSPTSSQVAECNRLHERLVVSQQSLADLQSLREVDALEIETRQVHNFFLSIYLCALSIYPCALSIYPCAHRPH